MTDVAATTTTMITEIQAAVAGKKGTKLDKKTDRPKPTHPTTAIMVNNAIQNLKERGGSSLQAIKKYISATYKIDGEKFSPFIKKYLKASVAAGTLVQTKGKGASGSFKLATSAVTKKPTTTVSKPKKLAVKPATKPKGKATEKKTSSVTESKKSTPVKSAKTKKAIVVEKKKPVVQTGKSKSPSKAKKTAKAPTKKPKSPKPKTTKPKIAKKKVSPKKK